MDQHGESQSFWFARCYIFCRSIMVSATHPRTISPTGMIHISSVFLQQPSHDNPTASALRLEDLPSSNANTPTVHVVCSLGGDPSVRHRFSHLSAAHSISRAPGFRPLCRCFSTLTNRTNSLWKDWQISMTFHVPKLPKYR